MKTIIAVLGLISVGMAGHSQIRREVSWADYASENEAGRHVILPTHDTRFAQLKVDNPSSKSVTVHVLTFDNPGIRKQTYAVTGMVRYEHVEGKAYLEMISVFSDHEQYFSKTLESGILAPLTGSSGWRRFVLPFDLMETKDKPKSLRINVVFPGEGVVYLGPLSIVEPAASAEMMGAPGQWWSRMWAARWSGIIGGAFGSLCGILGALTGWLAARGKGRKIILGAWTVTVCVSAVSLVAGIAALIVKQPYYVYYPLLMLGFIGGVVGGSLIKTVHVTYAWAEMRKMHAKDMMGQIS